MRHARADYNRFQDPAVDDPTLLGEGSTPIDENEPVFLLRAQDKHAASAVAFYAGLLAQDSAVDSEMAQVCARWAAMMQNWAVRKTPDMPRERIAAPETEITKLEAFHQELRLKDAGDYRIKINYVKAGRARLREALERIVGEAPNMGKEIAKAALAAKGEE